MSDYVIFTDSGCDLSTDLLKSLGIRWCSLTFMFDGENRQYENYEMPLKEFYGRMRAGEVARTSAVNEGAFLSAFREALEEGLDVFYAGISGGISTTSNSAIMAAEELKKEYPERKIVAIDTLCASGGLGLLLLQLAQKKEEGASIEELEQYVKENYLNLCHWYTPDDLVYLMRGGRVSKAAAVFGGLLGIKPVLNVVDDGSLAPQAKARGRKAAIKYLFDVYEKRVLDAEKLPFVITQADCPEDAKALDDMIRAKYGRGAEVISEMGPVIGAHAGPGLLGLFFFGTER